MTNYTFIVTFMTGITESIFTGCEETATILAQAKQINLGNQYEVASVVKQLSKREKELAAFCEQFGVTVQ